MEARPLITVVIANLNGERFLRECLSSIYSQSYKKIEVIVVDNGSTDKSIDIIKSEFPVVRLIRNAANKGFSFANNQGMEVAKGSYILALNNDAVIAPGFFDELVLAIRGSAHDVGMWAPKILSYADRGTIDSVGGLIIHADGIAKGRGRNEKDIGQYDSLIDVLMPSGCAALYSRAMLDMAGLFDPDFFAYCEDTDLGLRARWAGFRAISVPKALVYHHYSGTGGKYTPLKAFMVERNHVFVVAKNFPLRLVPKALVANSWRLILQAYGVLAKKGAGGNFARDFSGAYLAWILVKAYACAFAGFPRAIGKRLAFRSRRAIGPEEFAGLIERHSLKASELVFKD